MIRSPLRYPGGKFKAMPQIMPHIPAKVKDWREPFFGGGSVTLYYLQECMRGVIHEVTGEKREMPKTLTVGDLNPEIWAFWQGCKEVASEAAICALSAFAEYNNYYYRNFCDINASIEVALDKPVVAKFNKEYAPKIAEFCAIKVQNIIENLDKLYNEYGVSKENEMPIEVAYDILERTRGKKEEIKKELDDAGTPNVNVYSLLYDLGEKIFSSAKKLFEHLKEMSTEGEPLEVRCARQFLVNRISFSGMGDAGTLSKDQFTGFKVHDIKKLVEVQTVLENVEIRNCSFEEIMRLEPSEGCTADDVFIFLDPPYLTQESSGLYGKNGEMHLGFPHQLFVDECKKTEYKFLVTYDDSVQVRRMFRGLYLKPFKIPYTMAGKTSADALQGEELFIANFDLDEEEEEVFGDF